MADNAALLQDFGGESRVPYSNTGSAISAKDVVVLVSGASGLLGIAVDDIAATTGTGQVECSRVWVLAKKSGDVFTAFQQVYWDNTNHRLTTSSTSNTLAGRVRDAAASAATTANLIINRR
jgi:predicted RecA/RadA family phage recombinase